MVVFTCNDCGQSLKKYQIDFHYRQCRNFNSVSCMDCGEDFWGQAYAKHIKCISEKEKYGGKDFKATSNKGEAKQERWMEVVQNAILNAKMHPKLSSLMEKLMSYQNIPRKKIKFQKFVHNSIYIESSKLVDEAWEIFSKAQNTMNSNVEKDQNGIPKNVQGSKNEAESQTKVKTETPDSCDNMKNNIKGKKRKHKEENEKMSKKKHKISNQELPSEENIAAEVMAEDEEPKEKKKFKWNSVITKVLMQYPDQELSLKKLKKKVLAEYKTYENDGRSCTDQDLSAKFQKKISKNPKFKMHKDRVKLKQ